MIIEFYGLPGSGKTYLAGILSQKPGVVTSKVENKPELLWYSFLFLAKHPVKALVNFYLIILNSNSPFMFYAKVLNLLMHRSARYEKALKFKDKKVIIDEGHFQNVISIFEKPRPPEYFEKIVRFFSRPDKLVIFSSPDDYKLPEFSPADQGRKVFGKEYLGRWQGVLKQNHASFLKIVPRLGLPVVQVGWRPGKSTDIDKILA